MYAFSGCTCKLRLPPSIVSKKSNRIGNSSPNAAYTFLPSSSLGFAKTRLIEGVSNVTPSSNLNTKLFSSGTQSKPHAKFCCVRSRSQTSFNHWPPQGPGSKNGTTLKG